MVTLMGDGNGGRPAAVVAHSNGDKPLAVVGDGNALWLDNVFESRVKENISLFRATAWVWCLWLIHNFFIKMSRSTASGEKWIIFSVTKPPTALNVCSVRTLVAGHPSSSNACRASSGH